MLKWLDRLWGRIRADPVDAVEASREGLVIHFEGESRTLPWERVGAIAVQFVTGSPEARDIHYLFTLPERELRVSLATPGMSEFVTRLQRVPGFQRRTHEDAVRYCADTPVVIWRNPQHSVQG